MGGPLSWHPARPAFTPAHLPILFAEKVAGKISGDLLRRCGSAGRTQIRSTLPYRFRTIVHFVEDCARLVFCTVYTLCTLSTPLCLSRDRHRRTIINRRNQTRLTLSGSGFLDEQPTWSPDGTKLAFITTRYSTVVTWDTTMRCSKAVRVNPLRVEESG